MQTNKTTKRTWVPPLSELWPKNKNGQKVEKNNLREYQQIRLKCLSFFISGKYSSGHSVPIKVNNKDQTIRYLSASSLIPIFIESFIIPIFSENYEYIVYSLHIWLNTA